MAEIRLPQGLHQALSKVPDRLPFEDTVDRALDSLAARLEGNRVTKKLREIHANLPTAPEIELPGPFGVLKAPPLELPAPPPPKIDRRAKDTVKAALLDDISGVIEKIPVVGAVAGVLSDSLEDTAMARIHDLLTPEEYARFKKKDKLSPLTTVAVLDTFRGGK